MTSRRDMHAARELNHWNETATSPLPSSRSSPGVSVASSTALQPASTVGVSEPIAVGSNSPWQLPAEVVLLEVAEPPPHNVSADTYISGDEDGDGDDDRRMNSASVGVMRTSAQPTISQLRATMQRRTKRTRLKKGGVAPSLNSTGESPPPAHLPPSPSPGSAAASASASLPFAMDLPAERDSGNVEYKWKLIAKSDDRIVHLTTQLAYRLSEGGGQMLYELGVQDNGYAEGLSQSDLDASITTVTSMAATLQCDAQVITRAWGHEGVVAEVLVRRIGDVDATSSSSSQLSSSSPAIDASPSPRHDGDLRVAIIGASSAGKTSLLGCLVSNQLDDGRGRSRLHVFRHRHEIEKGRTSAIARQIIGFDAAGEITNYQVHHKQTIGVGIAGVDACDAFQTPAPAQVDAQTIKKQKGITSLFGDDEDEDESENGDDGDDDGVVHDFALALSPAASPHSPTSAAPILPSPPPQQLSLTSGDVSHACSTSDWHRILDDSHKVLTFFDLPPSEHFKTTISGLIGTSCPDYCTIVVPCEPQPTHSEVTVSALTREQILLCCALGIPFLLVLCKADLLPEQAARDRLIHSLQQICSEAHAPTGVRFQAPAGHTIVTHKIPVLVSSTAIGEEMDLLQRNMTDTILDEELPTGSRDDIVRAVDDARATHSVQSSLPYCYPPHTFTPLFFLSNVTGEGFNAFKRHLGRMRNYRHQYWNERVHTNAAHMPDAHPNHDERRGGVEFSIDEIFTVDAVGSVVSGTILSGVVAEGDTLLLGPIASPAVGATPHSSLSSACAAMFRPVKVKSLQISRKSFRNGRAGQSVTIALKKVDRALLRRGMVLLSVPHTSEGTIDVAPTASPSPSPIPPSWPRSCVGFEAYIRLFDPAAAHSSLPSHTHRNNRTEPDRCDRCRSPFSVRYQPIVHIGNVRQCAEIVSVRLVTDAHAQAAAEEWIAAHAHDEEKECTAGRECDLSTTLDLLVHAAAPSDAAASLSSTDTALLRTHRTESFALVRFEFLYQSEYLRCGRQVLFREDRTRGTGVVTKLFYLDDAEFESEATTSTLDTDASSPSPSSSPIPARSPACESSSSRSPRSARRRRSGAAADAGAALRARHATSDPFLQAKERRRRQMQQAQDGSDTEARSCQIPNCLLSPATPLQAAGDLQSALPEAHVHTSACLTASATGTPHMCDRSTESPHPMSCRRSWPIRHVSDSDVRARPHVRRPVTSPPLTDSEPTVDATLQPLSSLPPSHSASDSDLSTRRVSAARSAQLGSRPDAETPVASSPSRVAADGTQQCATTSLGISDDEDDEDDDDTQTNSLSDLFG